MSLTEKICDLDTFLAYSVALEEEAAERHDELADMMDVHNNPEVAEIFRQLAQFSRLHAQDVHTRAVGHDLPVIAPWEFEWEDIEGPETSEIGDVNYLMHPAQALAIAMANEKRAHDFYYAVSKESPDAEVRSLASEFAREEGGHLELLERWMKKYPEQNDEVYDPDPAHMPE